MGAANFDPLQNRNPSADCHKIQRNWLCPREDSLTKFGTLHIHPLGASGQIGKI